MKYLIYLGLCLCSLTCFSQTAQALYEKENYKGVIELVSSEKELTKEDLYFIGRSYFELEDDNKAIEYYDKAIKGGLNTKEVYFYKGLSFRWLGERKKAIQFYDKALDLDPDNQIYMTEKGLAYYYAKAYDSAFHYINLALEMPHKIGTPYYFKAHLQHLNKDFEAALKGFYEALKKLDLQDEYYSETLLSIGKLEYTVTKNYDKSVKAYTDLIALNPQAFHLYTKLIKAYYGVGDYVAGDSLFSIMKTAYENKELPEDYLEFGSVAIDEFEWNGQKVTTYRFFKEPQKSLDIMYKIYLLSPGGDKVERTLMIEQTIQLPDGPKHLLCERGRDGAHHTYPYGFMTDDIDYDELKEAAIMVFEGKMGPQASSNFGNTKKKNKKKKNK